MTPKKLQLRKKRVRVIIRELKKLFPKIGVALKYENQWELLVSVVLSAQCTDKKVNEVTAGLFKKYKHLNDYVTANPKEFEKDIKPTGFYKNKTKSILSAAKIVKDKYKGQLPKTIEEMITIPGVGRKTANVVLGNAYGVVEGIAVDTHVHRLSRKFDLTDYNDPVRIEKDLMEIVPKKNWFQFTYWLIEYGRNYSPARKKKDFDDPLSQKLLTLKLYPKK